MKMIGNVSDWLSYAGGALIKVADSAGSTVSSKQLEMTITKEVFWGNKFAVKHIFTPGGIF